jgi:hypothetical protein
MPKQKSLDLFGASKSVSQFGAPHISPQLTSCTGPGRPATGPPPTTVSAAAHRSPTSRPARPQHPHASHGTLDITALGGAGFASQRSTDDSRTWDLRAYSGIHLDLGKTDGNKYTFVIKDEVLELDDRGREQSTVSYEYDFTDAGAEGLYVPWSALKPFYRGKPKEDARALNLANVRRFSLMMRRFVVYRCDGW